MTEGSSEAIQIVVEAVTVSEIQRSVFLWVSFYNGGRGHLQHKVSQAIISVACAVVRLRFMPQVLEQRLHEWTIVALEVEILPEAVQRFEKC